MECGKGTFFFRVNIDFTRGKSYRDRDPPGGTSVPDPCFSRRSLVRKELVLLKELIMTRSVNKNQKINSSDFSDV